MRLYAHVVKRSTILNGWCPCVYRRLRIDSFGQVEWDTNPSFNSLGTKPLSYDANLGTSPEVEEIDADGSARYVLTGEVAAQ